MKKEDVLRVQIWARGWVDYENGNPYYAYLVKITTAHNSENLYIEVDGDWGSCEEDDIPDKWAFPAIKRWFGLKYDRRDIKSGAVEYHYKRVYKESELDNPRKWRLEQ